MFGFGAFLLFAGAALIIMGKDSTGMVVLGGVLAIIGAGLLLAASKED